MNQYEVMFIVRPDVEGEEAVDQQIERFGRLIVDNGGEVTGVDKWGRRRFAYEIDDLNEGFYVVMQFNAAEDVVSELGRIMKISDEILRHLVVRLDPRAVAQANAKRAAKEAAAAAQAAQQVAADAGAPAESAQAESAPEADSASEAAADEAPAGPEGDQSDAGQGEAETVTT